MYFSGIFGLHPQSLKMFQNHKSEMGVLLLTKVTLGPHARAGDCQKNQSY